MSPSEFESLTQLRQEEVLQNTLLQEFIFSISRYSKIEEENEDTMCYRIDQLAFSTHSN
jgi:hypothetical protein